MAAERVPGSPDAGFACNVDDCSRTCFFLPPPASVPRCTGRPPVMPRGSGRFERISDAREYTPQHFILEGFRNPGDILIESNSVGRNWFGGPTFRSDTQLCIRMAFKVYVRTRLLVRLAPGCPILAVFARVGIFRSSFTAFPVVVESKPPPFEEHKGWGTRAIYVKYFLGCLRLSLSWRAARASASSFGAWRRCGRGSGFRSTIRSASRPFPRWRGTACWRNARAPRG